MFRLSNTLTNSLHNLYIALFPRINMSEKVKAQEIVINESDNKLLEFCRDKERSLNEIARYLDIAPSSVVAKIKKLESYLKIERRGKGKKTLIRNADSDQTEEYMKDVLKVLQNRGGEMPFKDFVNIFPNDLLFEEGGRDKIRANRMVTYSNLVKHTISITPEGKKFLREHSK